MTSLNKKTANLEGLSDSEDLDNASKSANTVMHIALSDYFDWSTAEQFLNQNKLANPVEACKYFVSDCLTQKAFYHAEQNLHTALNSIEPDVYYMSEFWATVIQGDAIGKDESNLFSVVNALLRQTDPQRDAKKLLTAVVTGGSHILSEQPMDNNYTLRPLLGIKRSFPLHGFSIFSQLNEVLGEAFLNVFKNNDNASGLWTQPDAVSAELTRLIEEDSSKNSTVDNLRWGRSLSDYPFLQNSQSVHHFLDDTMEILKHNSEFVNFQYIHKFYQLKNTKCDFKIDASNFTTAMALNTDWRYHKDELPHIFLNIDFYANPDLHSTRSALSRDEISYKIFEYLLDGHRFLIENENFKNFFKTSVTKNHCDRFFQKQSTSKSINSYIEIFLSLHQDKTLSVLNAEDFWQLIQASASPANSSATPDLSDIIRRQNCRENLTHYFTQYFEPQKFQSFFQIAPELRPGEREQWTKNMGFLCSFAYHDPRYRDSMREWDDASKSNFLRVLCTDHLDRVEFNLKQLSSVWTIDQLKLLTENANLILSSEANFQEIYKHPEYKQILKNGDIIEEAFTKEFPNAKELFLFCAKKYKNIAQDLELNLAFFRRLKKEQSHVYSANNFHIPFGLASYVENRRVLFHDHSQLPSLCQALPALYQLVSAETWKNPEVCFSLFQNFDHSQNTLTALSELSRYVPKDMKPLVSHLSTLYAALSPDEAQGFKISEQYKNLIDASMASKKQQLKM